MNAICCPPLHSPDTGALGRFQILESSLTRLNARANADISLITVDGDKATITFKGALPTAFSQTGTVTFAPMDQIVCDLEGCRTMFCKGP